MNEWLCPSAKYGDDSLHEDTWVARVMKGYPNRYRIEHMAHIKRWACSNIMLAVATGAVSEMGE